MSNRILAFQNTRNNTTGRHKFHQFSEKRTISMNTVKIFSSLFSQRCHFQFTNCEPLTFNSRQYLASDRFFNGVRFDDQQRSFFGHNISLKLGYTHATEMCLRERFGFIFAWSLSDKPFYTNQIAPSKKPHVKMHLIFTDLNNRYIYAKLLKIGAFTPPVNLA